MDTERPDSPGSRRIFWVCECGKSFRERSWEIGHWDRSAFDEARAHQQQHIESGEPPVIRGLIEIVKNDDGQDEERLLVKGLNYGEAIAKGHLPRGWSRTSDWRLRLQQGNGAGNAINRRNGAGNAHNDHPRLPIADQGMAGIAKPVSLYAYLEPLVVSGFELFRLRFPMRYPDRGPDTLGVFLGDAVTFYTLLFQPEIDPQRRVVTALREGLLQTQAILRHLRADGIITDAQYERAIHELPEATMVAASLLATGDPGAEERGDGDDGGNGREGPAS